MRVTAASDERCSRSVHGGNCSISCSSRSTMRWNVSAEGPPNRPICDEWPCRCSHELFSLQAHCFQRDGTPRGSGNWDAKWSTRSRSTYRTRPGGRVPRHTPRTNHPRSRSAAAASRCIPGKCCPYARTRTNPRRLPRHRPWPPERNRGRAGLRATSLGRQYGTDSRLRAIDRNLAAGIHGFRDRLSSRSAAAGLPLQCPRPAAHSAARPVPYFLSQMTGGAASGWHIVARRSAARETAAAGDYDIRDASFTARSAMPQSSPIVIAFLLLILFSLVILPTPRRPRRLRRRAAPRSPTGWCSCPHPGRPESR